jgi:hypothetical protein
MRRAGGMDLAPFFKIFLSCTPASSTGTEPSFRGKGLGPEVGWGGRGGQKEEGKQCPIIDHHMTGGARVKPLAL